MLRAYAEDHGIEGEDRALFFRFMGEIDDEWLKYKSEQDKAAEKGGSDG